MGNNIVDDSEIMPIHTNMAFSHLTLKTCFYQWATNSPGYRCGLLRLESAVCSWNNKMGSSEHILFDHGPLIGIVAFSDTSTFNYTALVGNEVLLVSLDD